jgi:hypothetical protein
MMLMPPIIAIQNPTAAITTRAEQVVSMQTTVV